jgi:hypothetical protein
MKSQGKIRYFSIYMENIGVRGYPTSQHDMPMVQFVCSQKQKLGRVGGDQGPQSATDTDRRIFQTPFNSAEGQMWI